MLCAKGRASIRGARSLKAPGEESAVDPRIPESFQGWDDLADGHNSCVCRGVDCVATSWVCPL